MFAKANSSAMWHIRGLVITHATILVAVMLTVIPMTFVGAFLSSRAVLLEMEQRTIANQTAHVQNAIRAFEDNLSKSLGDYAEWDDPHNYLDSPNEAFEQSTLAPSTFANMGVDVITYVRFDGQSIFSRVVEAKTEQILTSESEEFALLTSSGDFFEAAKANRNHLAYVRTKRGLYVLYSQWISDSNGTGKARGFLVMGNLLGTQMLSDALQTAVALNLKPSRETASQLSADGRSAHSVTNAEGVESAIAVYGQDRNLLATIDFEAPRDLILTGRKALFAIAIALIVGLVCVAAMLAMAIRNRIQNLESFVRSSQDGAMQAMGRVIAFEGPRIGKEASAIPAPHRSQEAKYGLKLAA